jgi:hypothetical protein
MNKTITLFDPLQNGNCFSDYQRNIKKVLVALNILPISVDEFTFINVNGIQRDSVNCGYNCIMYAYNFIHVHKYTDITSFKKKIVEILNK